jgi:AcrR family transcriptional regulator
MLNAKKAKVLEAAQSVFFRYGYRRVTMGDIAAEAGISRPALYLLFCNKEEIFEATLRAFTTKALEEVRHGVAAQTTVEDKLRFVFQVWAIQPFELLIASPDAKELIDCSFAFAKTTIDESYAAIEAELAAILAPVVSKTLQPALPATQIARLLTRAVHGFKESATSVEELRGMVDSLVTLISAALRTPQTKVP